MSADASEAKAGSSQPIASPLSRVADGCAMLTFAIGLSVIAGWVIGMEPLVRILPTFAAMKFNTAIGFVLAGAALGWRRRPFPRLGFGALVVLLGSASLSGIIRGETRRAGPAFPERSASRRRCLRSA